MKRLFLLLGVMVMVMGVATATVAAPPPADKDGCFTIQGGTIVDSLGNAVVVGYDQFGYNYQAHIFVGTYDSSDRVIDGTYWGQSGDYVDDMLIMKWADEWIANVDCDGDGKLDRGLGTSHLGISQGWLTNLVEGDYFDLDGNLQHFTYFAKIVWTGTGPLWNQYTIIEEVYNDPAAGFSGLLTKVGAPGFGLNDHWAS